MKDILLSCTNWQDALQTAAARYQLVDQHLQELTSMLDSHHQPDNQATALNQAVKVCFSLKNVIGQSYFNRFKMKVSARTFKIHLFAIYSNNIV